MAADVVSGPELSGTARCASTARRRGRRAHGRTGRGRLPRAGRRRRRSRRDPSRRRRWWREDRGRGTGRCSVAAPRRRSAPSTGRGRGGSRRRCRAGRCARMPARRTSRRACAARPGGSAAAAAGAFEASTSWAARARSNRCARSVVVELQRPRERLEHGVGDSSGVAAFEAGVVVDADAGEQRHFFPAKTGDATRAAAVRAQSGLLGRDPGAPGGQELADLVAGVHDSRLAPLQRPLRGPASTWINRVGQSLPAPASVVPRRPSSRQEGTEGHD